VDDLKPRVKIVIKMAFEELTYSKFLKLKAFHRAEGVTTGIGGAFLHCYSN
jgi:hypothetical protein